MKSVCKIYVLLGIMMFCSCNSWLDVKLIDQSQEADLFSTERGFDEALAGVYYDMSSAHMYGQVLSFGMLDIMSRIYDYSQVPDGMKIYRDYEYRDATMEGTIHSIWAAFYENIASLNNILEWSERNASVLSEEKRNQIRGEVLALRAFHHFDIYRLFAPDVKLDKDSKILPYQLKFGVKPSQVYSTEDYLKLVIKDLKDALNYLENDPIKGVAPYELGNGEEKNKNEADLYVARMNYYAVKALLARIYLDLGEEWKKEARQLAEEVIDSKKFALLDYEKSLNVEVTKKDLLFSDEHIFSLRNQEIKSSAEAIHQQVSTSDGNIQMSKNFHATMYENDLDDYRLNWFKEIYVVKYSSENDERFFPKIPMIRLSEMYLIAAEGWMDDDPEKASEFLQTFKQARTKKSVAKQVVDKKVLIREIRKEFLGEGQLFYAYKRLNHDIIGNTSEDGMFADNNIFVFPLPQAEIEYGNRN